MKNDKKNDKKNKKGFTLAELLIVVAIIGVLVAIAIPILNGRLERARFATNQANARGAYAAALATYITDETSADSTDEYFAGMYDIGTGTFDPETPTNLYDVFVDARVKGQPGDWSVDDSDLEGLRKTVYTGYIIVYITRDGEITEYRFKNR